jgi:hypothetical protein
MLVVMGSTKVLKINILMGSVECCEGIKMVQKWLDMYRDQGEYILT